MRQLKHEWVFDISVDHCGKMIKFQFLVQFLHKLFISFYMSEKARGIVLYMNSEEKSLCVLMKMVPAPH